MDLDQAMHLEPDGDGYDALAYSLLAAAQCEREAAPDRPKRGVERIRRARTRR